MSKFTAEFIKEQRLHASRVDSLPWSGAGRPPCILNKNHERIFTGQDSNVPGEIDNWNEIWYAQDAANNYLAALAEIEELQAWINRAMDVNSGQAREIERLRQLNADLFTAAADFAAALSKAKGDA